MAGPWEKYRTVPAPPGAEQDPTGFGPLAPSDPNAPGFVESLIGRTPTEKAVTGATAVADIARLAGMLPNPVARTAGVLLPIATGAGMEYLQGGSPWSGAATGALQSVLPNIAAAGTGAALRQRKDVKELTNVVKEHLPVLAPHVDRKITTWDRLFRGGEARKIAGDALRATKDKIKNAVGIQGEVFPLLSSVTEKELEKEWTSSGRASIAQFDAARRQQARTIQANTTARPFEVWDQMITDLNNEADRFGRKKAAKKAALRKQAFDMTEELTERIRQVDPELADEYSLYRHQMHDTLALERVLSKKGVITSGTLGNRIDMGKLQDLMNDPDVRTALESSPMGKRFLLEAFRGAPPIGGDIPPEFRTRVYGHPSLQHFLPMGGLSGHPTLGQRVGRRVPIPATPFEFLQNLFTSGMGQEQQ